MGRIDDWRAAGGSLRSDGIVLQSRVPKGPQLAPCSDSNALPAATVDLKTALAERYDPAANDVLRPRGALSCRDHPRAGTQPKERGQAKREVPYRWNLAALWNHDFFYPHPSLPYSDDALGAEAL